jgi:hypothetical protein
MGRSKVIHRWIDPDGSMWVIHEVSGKTYTEAVGNPKPPRKELPMPTLSPNAAFAMANKDGAATIIVTDRDGKPNMYTQDEATALEKSIHDARQEGERLTSAVGHGAKMLEARVPAAVEQEDREKQIKEANEKADARIKEVEAEAKKGEQQRRTAAEAVEDTDEHKARRVGAHR